MLLESKLSLAQIAAWQDDHPSDSLTLIYALSGDDPPSSATVTLDAYDLVNSIQDLQQGRFWIDHDYTQVPPLEQLGMRQRITSRFLVDFAKLAST